MVENRDRQELAGDSLEANPRSITHLHRQAARPAGGRHACELHTPVFGLWSLEGPLCRVTSVGVGLGGCLICLCLCLCLHPGPAVGGDRQRLGLGRGRGRDESATRGGPTPPLLYPTTRLAPTHRRTPGPAPQVLLLLLLVLGLLLYREEARQARQHQPSQAHHTTPRAERRSMRTPTL
ncbi:hypothetical protein GALMADRAFT_1033431 [Galerina marginata CBS 339.88]|uniref:Uncharacterized protein n=1 Tax=Galerina marginata (strain CBS 339.88) TaxID=685588 RepID=A0A067SC67_GALM3|nr:hypothetical protein GALMADRAFT_1033431 [Galerina marginata CBS 339.88]